MKVTGENQHPNVLTGQVPVNQPPAPPCPIASSCLLDAGHDGACEFGSRRRNAARRAGGWGTP